MSVNKDYHHKDDPQTLMASALHHILHGIKSDFAGNGQLCSTKEAAQMDAKI